MSYRAPARSLAIVIALSAAYHLAFVELLAVLHSLAYHPPDSWALLFGDLKARHLSWWQSLHLFGLLAVSLPVAAGIVWSLPGCWLRASLSISCVAFALQAVLHLPSSWGSMSGALRVVAVLELSAFAVVLPVLTWLLMAGWWTKMRSTMP